ncbi:ABC transporter substrate-binding protein [Gordonia sp. VNK21]|uniref:ABC transporter substrate-binding protein n=1 Tax=Gordonia sp. VNK21 TaxID=3382483 RepID=UPI0038D3EA00
MTRALVAVLSAVALLVAGCTAQPAATGRDRSCVDDYRAGTDYFPDRSAITHATNFTVDYHDDYALLTVKQPFPGGSPQSYLLVRCGVPDPQLSGAAAQATRIEVPVRTVYSGSTTQLPFFGELDVLDALTGVADAGLVTDAQVRSRVAEKKIAEYGAGGVVNTEAVLAARPDVLLTDGTDSDVYPVLRKAGIPVLAFADWLESTPLGKAEWIKVLGLLTGTSATADRVFGDISRRYDELAARARSVTDTDVLYGTEFQGTWTVPAGDSAAGVLVRDAGGDWPWSSRTGNSVQLSFEDIVTGAGELPIWLVSDNQWTSIDDVLRQDPRYRALAAVRDGQVWNANLVIGPGGGNDYFERGSARPDLVLADVLAILHPELMPDHTFTFFRRLSRG